MEDNVCVSSRITTQRSPWTGASGKSPCVSWKYIRWRERRECLYLRYEEYNGFGKETSAPQGTARRVWNAMVVHRGMPIDEDGLSMDIIVNPHSIPSRMTVNQIIEMVEARLGWSLGYFIDALRSGSQAL
jgi:hypothetical protein